MRSVRPAPLPPIKPLLIGMSEMILASALSVHGESVLIDMLLPPAAKCPMPLMGLSICRASLRDHQGVPCEGDIIFGAAPIPPLPIPLTVSG